MSRTRWFRRHRVLTAFLAGVLLTLMALAGAGYYVLSDQRRAARVLAGALSRALAREVRIDRVTDIGTERLVMRGVELRREGGWPARVVADRVEVTGPLLAAARGDAAPVRLTVTGPTVEIGAEGGAGLAGLGALAEGVRSLLASPLALDVRLAGGTVKRAGGGAAGFDLTFLKERGAAQGELTLREGPARPLVLDVTARQDGETVRLALTASGGLAPLGGVLPAGATALGDRALELRLDVDFGAGGSLVARGRAGLGEALVARGAATFKDGVLEVTLPEMAVDLGVGAAVAGLGWRPTGRAELSEVSATWRAAAGAWPSLRASLRVPALAIPAAGAGTEVTADGLEAQLRLEPADAGLGVSGEARAARLRAAGVAVAPVETRYRVSLDGRGSVVRADLDALQARVEGARLQGTVGYDGAGHRLEARLEGDQVEAGDLLRRLAPGWLGPADHLRLAGLRVTVTGLDARALRQGTARLDARSLRLERADGQLTAALSGHVELGPDAVTLAVEAERVGATLPGLTGDIPRLSASVGLARRPDGGLHPARAALTARDRGGRELVVATLGPATAAGRLRLTAEAPALERLDGLWPAIPRHLTGSARLDAELSAADLASGQGRLALRVSEGELWGGKVEIRDLAADVPVRRGGEGAAEPPWGTLGVGELIGYGVVVHDLTTPARIWHDRLSLNDLAYVLYAGTGKGWSEVELGPAGLSARGRLAGSGIRVEELMSSYGVRGGTMTGLMDYGLDYQYRAGRLGLTGRFEVPDGGTVNIELLNRVLGYAGSDPSGVVRRALENLRAFDYKHAGAEVRSAGDEIRVSLSLQGRERFLIFPAKVREINILNMPLSFLARQFPGS